MKILIRKSFTDSYLLAVTLCALGCIFTFSTEVTEAALTCREVLTSSTYGLSSILNIEDAKLRVEKLSQVKWTALTPQEQILMLESAPGLKNSFEIGAFIKIAGSSQDSRWVPILKTWHSEWNSVSRGWQTFLKPALEQAIKEIAKEPKDDHRIVDLSIKDEQTGPLNVAKGEVHYQIFGAQNKETLVLIHGLDSNAGTFYSVTEALASKYKVVVYDQRGHGKTKARGVDYSTTIMANDLKALLDQLNIVNAHVLGHSMGARTAAKFAALFPDRVKSIILEDMELIAREKYTEAQMQKYLDLAKQLYEAFGNKVFPTREALKTALRPYYGDESESLSKRKALENLDGSVTLLFRPEVSILYGHRVNMESLSSDLASSHVPVFLMRAEPKKGSGVSTKGALDIQEKIPSVRIETISGSGHVMHRTHPAEFVDLLSHFINSQGSH